NTSGAILNWNSFSIGAQNAVNFVQPSSTSKVLNRVTGNDPSSILGSLSSNGQVWLLNPNGVLFGQGARVNVASLVTSTLNLNDADWTAGRYVFSAPVSGSNGVAAGITNQGEIRSAAGGQVMLIGAGEVRNEGIIEASGGQIVLAAGASVELVDTASPRFSVKVSAPQGEVLNLGQINAAGGRIDVVAASVNQQGIVRADSLGSGPGGEIVINAASQRLTLAAGSRTSADGASGGSVQLLGTQVALMDGASVSASGAAGSGGTVLVGGGVQGQDLAVPNADAVYFAPGASIAADGGGTGQGGHIVLWSNSATRAFGSLSAHGGAQGGDGGLIETSGGWLDARPAKVDVSAPHGKAGTWLLDPHDITISDSVSDSGTDASFNATADSSTISSATLAAALSAGSAVTVQTGSGGSQSGTITVSDANIVITSASPGSLSLIADANINVFDSVIQSQNPMPVSLKAGRSGSGAIDISNSTIASGGGAITLGGFGSGTQTYFGSTSVFFDAASVSYGGAITLENGSILDGGGTGSVSLKGNGTSYGVEISSSVIRHAADLSIIGSGGSTAGVLVAGSSLASVGAMTVLGNAQTGKGLSITGVSVLRVESTDGSGPALNLQGNSSLGGRGVEITSAGTLVQGGTNSNLTIYATNGPSGSFVDTTLALAGTFDNSLGASITLEAHTLDSQYPATVKLTNANVTGGYGSVMLVGAGTLQLKNTQISAPSQVMVEADNVTLDTGTTITSSTDGLNTTDAIVISGSDGSHAVSSFFNIAGSTALQATGGNGARWIVWADDVLDAQRFSGGNLDYGFTVHSAQSTSAASPYTGNAFLSTQAKTATASADDASRAYDGTRNVPLSNLAISGPGGAVGTLVDPSFVQYASKDVNGSGIVFDGSGVTYVDSNSKPVYGMGLNSTLTGTITPKAITATLSVTDKTYDTTTSATVGVVGLNGLVGSETLGSSATGTFADPHAGQGKAVTATVTLSDGSGGLAANYSIGTTMATGNILPAPVTISGVTAVDKVYDATTVAALTGTAVVTALGGDTLSVGGTATAAFADKNVGTAKPVIVTGFTLTGA
ncbi:YDG domain-containing protein, partial [Pelomonas sp. KK5]|uniref:two-partner secretion domain-containing protein n=1 Tax=Pelomonas sp. KK5 TaxID=1855730 RepID=UPI00097C39E2